MKIEQLTYANVHERAVAVASRIAADGLINDSGVVTIHGVPRGGVPVMYEVASCLRQMYGTYTAMVTTAEPGSIVVDDIVDSGRTRSRYADHPFYALVDKDKEPDIGWIVFPWEVSATTDHEEIVTRVIEAIGDDASRDGLKDTPARVVRSWAELYRGYTDDPREVLSRTFDNEEHYDQMVLVRNIEFYSTCEHHMLPFFGKAHVAYIPSAGGRIVGLSKIARLVDGYARRLQIQERLTQQIAGALEETLHPLGVAVTLEAQHLCMLARGARQSEAVMVTSAVKGDMRDDERARMEMLLLRK